MILLYDANTIHLHFVIIIYYVSLESENVKLEDGSLDAIMKASEGDMRKAMTYLQSCHQLCGASGTVTSDVVSDITGMVSIENTINIYY